MRRGKKKLAHTEAVLGRGLAWQIQRTERGHYDVVGEGKIALEFGTFPPQGHWGVVKQAVILYD